MEPNSSGADLLSRARSLGDQGDAVGKEETVNEHLRRQPWSVIGHIIKGDCRLAAGDPALATYFFRRAAELAQRVQPQPDIAAEVERARLTLRELETRTDTLRRATMAQRGFPQHMWSPRLKQALDIAAGRKKLYLQEPTAFTYPELPHIQFYDPGIFPWASQIEAEAPTIRHELLKMLERGTDEFRPYLGDDVALIPHKADVRLNSQDWSVRALCEMGWIDPQIIHQCPRTWEAVLKLPLPRISGWGPTVVFSLLKAGARIPPHTGMFNTRLICHLPLIVPPGCRFRVGNEIREWEEGKLMIFDDTIEHEAWNDSDKDRIVLIFDIWRPELDEQERRELTALLSD